MLKQRSGSVVSINAARDERVGSMMTKGGLNTLTRRLAIEYASHGLRFNAVAPGVVDTPMHGDVPRESLAKAQPMGKVSEVNDIVDAVLYLTRASEITGEVLDVDGGSHAGCW